MRRVVVQRVIQEFYKVDDGVKIDEDFFSKHSSECSIDLQINVLSDKLIIPPEPKEEVKVIEALQD